MRQMISATIAALAVVTAGAVPAGACGLTACNAGYVPPAYYGCGLCGGAVYGYAGYEHLADPAYQYGAQPYQVHQYYYVNQGPTYSGPGDFAPVPTYQEGGYAYRPHYHNGYRYWGHRAPHSVRYGYHGVPHHYGYHGTPLRRYY